MKDKYEKERLGAEEQRERRTPLSSPDRREGGIPRREGQQPNRPSVEQNRQYNSGSNPRPDARGGNPRQNGPRPNARGGDHRQNRPRPDARSDDPRQNGSRRDGRNNVPPRGERRQGQDNPKENPIFGIIKKIKGKMTPKVTVIASVCAVAAVFVVCMLVNIFIGVRSIEVVGNDLAGDTEIAEMAGIYPGSGYFSYNTGKAEKTVKENIHCISEIKISRSFFGKVKITVTEKKPLWYMEVYGEYYVLSDSLEVIRQSDMRDDFVRRGLVRVDFPEVKSTVLGKRVEYADGDRDCGFIPGFLSEIAETQLFKSGRINQIKMETKFEIFTVCDLKHKVHLGKSDDAGMKLMRVGEVLRSIGEGAPREINASDISNITVFENHNLDFSYLKPLLSE